ncbi:MAG: glycosyltransferase family 2 protein [Acidobacteriaceae bacterium]
MVAAVVVLYNPEIRLLDRLLRSVIGQVERIFVIDNTSDSTVDFGSFFHQYTERISYLALGENKGVATAQNIGIRESIKAGCSHVLFLDQDSSLPPDMVKQLLDAEVELVNAGKRIAAVGPLFVDEKTGRSSRATRHDSVLIHRILLDRNSRVPVETDYLIASGSLIRCEVLADIGMMRDELFIDWVDVEWGLRAKRHGYRCYVVPTATMTHSIGDKIGTLWGFKIRLHSDVRHYYMVRNAAYLIRSKTMGWQRRIITACKLPINICLFSWFSVQKIKSFKLLLRALLDGMGSRTGQLAPNLQTNADQRR